MHLTPKSSTTVVKGILHFLLSGKRFRFSYACRVCLFLVLALPGYSIISADSFSEHRIKVGLKLFRTLVKADLDISKKTGHDNAIHIVLVSNQNGSHALSYEKTLRQSFVNVEKNQYAISSMSPDNIIGKHDVSIAALFIGEVLSAEELHALIQYAYQHNIIIFSPFEGDVENGVLAGLSVQATVRPLINSKALSKTALNIKPFYLKVAKRYE